MSSKDISPKEKERRDYRINCIMLWLLFGVLLVVSPPLFYAFYQNIVGIDVDFRDYIPDILLAVVSICCNLLCNCLDMKKRVTHLWRWLLGMLFGMIIFLYWGGYVAVRFATMEKIKLESTIRTTRWICYISLGIVFVCTIVGIVVEVVSNSKKKQKSENKNEKK